MSQFEAFNQKIINNKTNINLLDYVRRCNFNNIDLSFIDKFIELVSRTDFCIPHTYLKDYGIYKLSSGSDDLKKKLESNGFKDGIDFRLRKVSESASQGGRTHYSDYMLTPDTFKTLLIRSTKCKTYANYYIYLEKCIKYYNDYQIELKERYILTLHERITNYDIVIIPQKDDKIDELMKKVDNLFEENKSQTLQIRELLANSKETNERLSDVEDILEDTKVDLSVVQDKLEIAVEDRAVKPYDKSKVNQIAILRSLEKDNRYYLTCGQKDSVNRSIKRKSDSYTHVETIDCVPNPIYLFDHIKKLLESKNKAKVVSRTIQLLTISEESFIDDIKSLFDGRRNVDLTKRP